MGGLVGVHAQWCAHSMFSSAAAPRQIISHTKRNRRGATDLKYLPARLRRLRRAAVGCVRNEWQAAQRNTRQESYVPIVINEQPWAGL
jgi:hypothetical protein